MRRRWMSFRRALSKEDQEAFDQMFADATQQPQTEVHLGRPWGFETLIMAVFMAHKKRFEQARTCVEPISAETHLPEGNPPAWRR